MADPVARRTLIRRVFVTTLEFPETLVYRTIRDLTAIRPDSGAN
jgi:hypothetical protein